MLRPLLELLNGTAFRPDPINSEVRMAERFSGKTVLAVGFRPGLIKAAPVRFARNGTVTVGQESTAAWAQNDGADVIRRFVQKAAGAAKTEDVVLVGSHQWLSNLTDITFPGSDRERNRLLVEEPNKIVGENAGEATVLAIVTHPTVSRTLKFAFTKAELLTDCAIFHGTGLRLSRLSSGCYAILRYLAEEAPESIKGKELLIVDGNSALMVFSNDTAWDDSGFVSGFRNAAEAAEKVGELVSRRTDPTARLAVVSTIELDAETAKLTGSNIEHLLTTQSNPDFFCVCSEGKEHVATDLNPEPSEPRPHLPKSRRAFVFSALAISLGCGAGAVAVNLATLREVREINAAHEAQNALISEGARISEAIGRIERDRAKADLLGKWVSLGVSVQPIIVTTVESADNGVSLDEFSLRTGDGAPQMEMKVVARGDSRRIGAYIDKVSNAFGAAGFNLSNLDQTPAPGANAIIFVGRYNYPIPSKISWKKE